MIFTLTELSERLKETTENDIIRMAADGELALSTWFDGLFFTGDYSSGDLKTAPYLGYADIPKEFVAQFIQFEEVPISQLILENKECVAVATAIDLTIPGPQDIMVRVNEPKQSTIKVQKLNLVVRVAEVRRWEGDHLKLLPEEARANAELKPSERKSLAKMVYAMAVDGYGYNPEDKKSPVPEEIAKAVAGADMNITADTVRKWLKEGARLKKENM